MSPKTEDEKSQEDQSPQQEDQSPQQEWQDEPTIQPGPADGGVSNLQLSGTGQPPPPATPFIRLSRFGRPVFVMAANVCRISEASATAGTHRFLCAITDTNSRLEVDQSVDRVVRALRDNGIDLITLHRKGRAVHFVAHQITRVVPTPSGSPPDEVSQVSDGHGMVAVTESQEKVIGQVAGALGYTVPETVK